MTLRLFKSYLTNRTQVVQISNVKSEKLYIRSGVPQGSILGPILFLLYINDLTIVCDDLNIDLYADDSNLYESGYNKSIIENKLQFKLNCIQNWCRINNMCLHPHKSKCMLLGSRIKLQKLNTTLSLDIDNIKLQNVCSVTC